MLFTNAVPYAFAHRDDSEREFVPGGIVDPRTKRRKVISDDQPQAALDLGDGQRPPKLLVPDVADDRIPEVPHSASVELLPQIAAGLENVIGKDIPIAVIDLAPLRQGHDEVRKTHSS